MPLSMNVTSSPSSPLMVMPSTWSTVDTMPGPSKSWGMRGWGGGGEGMAWGTRVRGEYDG